MVLSYLIYATEVLKNPHLNLLNPFMVNTQLYISLLIRYVSLLSCYISLFTRYLRLLVGTSC